MGRVHLPGEHSLFQAGSIPFETSNENVRLFLVMDFLKQDQGPLQRACTAFTYGLLSKNYESGEFSS